MATLDLPSYPSKGGRRTLDAGWLALLHRDGLPPFLEAEPKPPPELGLAIRQFNRGEFYSCHETLERVWLPETYPVRLYYQGLIKAAVGLLHLERHNRRGAIAKLRDAEYELAPFVPRFMAVDTLRLHRDVTGRLACLQAHDRVDWEAIDRLPPVLIASG